jgi:uncharacterized membrane protein YgaE (UPF0421/DUF939 family)
MRIRTPHLLRDATRRLRPRLLPIGQTALAAVAAYYVALLLPIDDRVPTFASIAAVISLSASHSRRGMRAVELTAGVVLGLSVADVVIRLVGVGPLQIGLMIVVAMCVAVVLHGRSELFVNEAAISGLILVSLVPAGTSGALSFTRPIEAVVGGITALVVGSLLFPPDPRLLAGRAAHRVFGDLGHTLDEIATALRDGDPERAGGALVGARALDGTLAELDAALSTARETANLSPARRRAGEVLGRYERTRPNLEFAIRDTRILARHAVRYSRTRLPAPDELHEAVRTLAGATWSLADAHDDPTRADGVRGDALGAAARARTAYEREPDLGLTEIVSQVRTTAVDLVRAADLLAGDVDDAPTEELLALAPLAA